MKKLKLLPKWFWWLINIISYKILITLKHFANLSSFSAFGFQNFDEIEAKMATYEQKLTAFAAIMTNPADDVSARMAEGLVHAPSQGLLVKTHWKVSCFGFILSDRVI